MRHKFSFLYVDTYSDIPKFEMLVVVSLIFVAYTKITFGYNFGAPLCIRSFKYYFLYFYAFLRTRSVAREKNQRIMSLSCWHKTFQYPEVFYSLAILKCVSKFTGKKLCRRLFLKMLQATSLQL